MNSVSPMTAFPSQQISILISGITCEKWMTFLVRFQSQNGTKRTQQGVCVNSTVTCYLPEFPAQTLLRVGVTLNNRIVEWSPIKVKVQCKLVVCMFYVLFLRRVKKREKKNINKIGSVRRVFVFVFYVLCFSFVFICALCQPFWLHRREVPPDKFANI